MVHYDDWVCYQVEGIFSTREKAQEYVDKKGGAHSYVIYEYILDEASK